MEKEIFMEAKVSADKVVVDVESPVPLVLQAHKVFRACKVFRDPRDNQVCLEQGEVKAKKVYKHVYYFKKIPIILT